MSLGTNYARTPSKKQMDRHWENWALHQIKAGKSKEEFLLQFKEFARPKMSEVWDKMVDKK